MRTQYISLHSGTFSRKSLVSRTAGFSETLALEETMGLPGNGIEFPKRLNLMKKRDQLFATDQPKEYFRTVGRIGGHTWKPRLMLSASILILGEILDLAWPRLQIDIF
jgi:hypothetical protein